MSSITSIGQQPVSGLEPGGRTDPVKEAATTPTRSDISGAALINQIKDHTLPPIAAGKSDLELALSTLQGKTAQIQQSLTLVANLFAASGDQNTQLTVNGLVNELFAAATSSDGPAALNVFCRGLGEMIDQAMSQSNDKTVLGVCHTAKELIDILSDPEKSRNDALIQLELNQLKAHVDGLKSDNPAAMLAGGLALIFGEALSALNMSNQLHDILSESGRLGFLLPPNLAEMSGLVTVLAMLSLMSLVATQVSTELEARLTVANAMTQTSRDEDVDKTKEEQAEMKKKMEEYRLREQGNETLLNQAESASVMNAALTQSFGGALGGGLSDAFSLVLNKVIEARQRTRAPVEA